MAAPDLDSPDAMRIDRWLDIACLCKTRTQATQACKKGQVIVNGQSVKPNRMIRPGDEIELRTRDWPLIVEVLQLSEKTVAKSIARTFYEDLSPPRPKFDPLERILRMPPVKREKGKGRPTKRERRRIDRLRDDDDL